MNHFTDILSDKRKFCMNTRNGKFKVMQKNGKWVAISHNAIRVKYPRMVSRIPTLAHLAEPGSIHMAVVRDNSVSKSDNSDKPSKVSKKSKQKHKGKKKHKFSSVDKKETHRLLNKMRKIRRKHRNKVVIVPKSDSSLDIKLLTAVANLYFRMHKKYSGEDIKTAFFKVIAEPSLFLKTPGEKKTVELEEGLQKEIRKAWTQELDLFEAAVLNEDSDAEEFSSDSIFDTMETIVNHIGSSPPNDLLEKFFKSTLENNEEDNKLKTQIRNMFVDKVKEKPGRDAMDLANRQADRDFSKGYAEFSKMTDTVVKTWKKLDELRKLGKITTEEYGTRVAVLKNKWVSAALQTNVTAEEFDFALYSEGMESGGVNVLRAEDFDELMRRFKTKDVSLLNMDLVIEKSNQIAHRRHENAFGHVPGGESQPVHKLGVRRKPKK
jgi:hypothetical protein